MNRLLVLPPDFDDYAWEVEAKGVLWDAAVRISGRACPITFYDPVRLQQDVSEVLADGRDFSAIRLLVVKRVTLENMREAVNRAPAELFE